MRPHTIMRMMVLTAMIAGTAWAQEDGRIIVSGAGQPAPPLFDFKVEMLAVEPFELGDPVENAPYSADIVTEVTQELPDGNRIERNTTGAVARDGRGRVRREHQLAAIGPVLPEGQARMVTISDPVAGVHYSLDPVRKVAMRSRPSRGHAALPGPTILRTGDLAVPSEAPGASTNRIGPDELSLESRGEPELPDVRTEQLGTKEYEGVRAEGTRTVATLPAGAIGNVRPIEVVSERWYSPELGVVVFSRRADPRFGETVYRLTNIIRAEPDASLFQVPADYKHEDMRRPLFEKPIDR